MSLLVRCLSQEKMPYHSSREVSNVAESNVLHKMVVHFLPAVRSALPVGVVGSVIQDDVDDLVILLYPVSKGYLHRSCDVHFQPGRSVGLLEMPRQFH